MKEGNFGEGGAKEGGQTCMQERESVLERDMVGGVGDVEVVEHASD